MMDYQTNPDGAPQRFSTPYAAGAIVIGALLLLIVFRYGLRGLL